MTVSEDRRSLDIEPDDTIVLREAGHAPGHDIPESLAHGLYRTAVWPRRLAYNKTPSVAFIKRAKESHFRFANLYWRFFFINVTI